MIVMGTHGRSRIGASAAGQRRGIRGRNSKVPVLTVRAAYTGTGSRSFPSKADYADPTSAETKDGAPCHT